MDKSKSSYSPSNSLHIQKLKKVRREKPTNYHNSSRLERTSVEFAVKKTIGKKDNSGPSRESVKEGKSNDKKRVKTLPRKHVCPCAESELDTSELIKDNDKKKILSRGKSLRKKLESISSYSSMKQKGYCLAMELFKNHGFEVNKITILFKSLADSTFLSYQFGWGIFAEYIMAKNFGMT
jgi:hypothetical protein